MFECITEPVDEFLHTHRKYIRTLKQAIFMILGIYSSITMFIEAVKTFSKAPDFTTEKPDDRCISYFDKAEAFGIAQNNTIVAYSVFAGRYRWGFCTDLSDAELDAEFGVANLYDPLEDATDGDCNLADDRLYAQRVAGCTIRNGGSSSVETCASAMAKANESNGVYGIAWGYTITLPDESTSSSTNQPSGGNATATAPLSTNGTGSASPSSGNKTTDCRAVYTKDNDMPPCPYSNVRFYGTENKYISVVFMCAAILNILMWVGEFLDVMRFGYQFGDNYGDLSLLSAAMDGTVGGFYVGWRVYIEGEPQVAPEPGLTWFQFFRSLTSSGLAQTVSGIAIFGCAITKKNARLLVLFLVMTAKMIYTVGSKTKEQCWPAPPDPKEILESAGDVAPPPDMDPGLNDVVRDVVSHGKDPEYMQKIKPSIDKSSSKRLYHKCLAKLLLSGSDCIPSEINRITVIIQRPTTDPSVYNECITWLQLLHQCQDFKAGGPGNFPPPAFPNWRDKVAPELHKAAEELAKKKGQQQAQELLNIALLQQARDNPPEGLTSPANQEMV